MDIDTIFTEKPLFIITKQYDAVKIEDLTEVFAVIFKVELPNYEQVPDEDENTKKSARYLFFTDLEKAFKQFKYYGPRRAILQRIFTDKEELIETAEKSNFTIVPDDDENSVPNEEKDTSTEVKELIV
jgi:hypothetical protein